MEPDPVILNLIERRHALGLSQRQLADILHVKYNTVGSWECGAVDPSLWRLREWCRVLGMVLSVQLGADVIADA